MAYKLKFTLMIIREFDIGQFHVSRTVQNISQLYCLIESVTYRTTQPAVNEIEIQNSG